MGSLRKKEFSDCSLPRFNTVWCYGKLILLFQRSICRHEGTVGTRASLPGIKLKAIVFRKYFLPLTLILHFVFLF
jgi:hypothetical protein